MFQILVYCFPFAHILFHPRHDLAASNQGILNQVLHGDLNFSSDAWPSISDGAQDLVKRMLVRDPRRHLTAQEVLLVFFYNFIGNGMCGTESPNSTLNGMTLAITILFILHQK